MQVTDDVSRNLERFQVHLENKQRANKGTNLLLPRKIELGFFIFASWHPNQSTFDLCQK